MNTKLILDYEELPHDKKRIKWGTAIIEKEDILWQGKPVDKRKINFFNRFIFFLVNAVFAICLISELWHANIYDFSVFIIFSLIIFPIVYYRFYKNRQDSKTEYVITEDAILFRLLDRFKIKTYRVPLTEIVSVSLEKFDHSATIHVQTVKKVPFLTHNVITGNPQYHPTIEHVENYEEAFDFLKTACGKEHEKKGITSRPSSIKRF